MTPSLSCFDGDELSQLLHRAGAGTKPRRAVPAPVPTPGSASPAPAPAPEKDPTARVRAVAEPGQRALGAALAALLGDLSRVLHTSLFVADDEGLLIAGAGDAPAAAASIAADALRSLAQTARFAATRVDGLLLRTGRGAFLVFAPAEGAARYVVGAQVDDDIPLGALRAAAERILQTLLSRTQNHA